MTSTSVRKAPIKNPYDFHKEDVAEPPTTFLRALRRIGPGMILAASIVGSGELIATTTLGAQVGYLALWIILLSCAVKPVIQAEMGRYTIVSGQTGLESFNSIPGPRWKVNWVVWAWAGMVLMTLLQIGAMFGGVAQVMNILLPSVPVNLWVLLFSGVTLALLLGGGYERIEGLATIKVGLFTMLTLLCAMLLLSRPEFFSWEQLAEGLKLRLPGNGIATAVAVFGITGVGAAELFMYPYWCLEKGYARFTGKRDDSAEWLRRARGWIRIMHLDIACSMVIYTVATIAFYVLGAGVLNGMGLVPAASDMIKVLSNIYTQTLGPWSLPIFFAGAIATLYGTIFAATASNARLFADMMRLMGRFERNDYAARVRYRHIFVVLLTVIPVILYLSFQSPVKMVVIGGIFQSMMLPVIGFGTVFLRHKKLPAIAAPSHWTTFFLWFSSILIAATVGYAVFSAA
ncbi:MAG: Nramp family divalent metal transporter [Bryobacteraceae bacterium]